MAHTDMGELALEKHISDYMVAHHGYRELGNKDYSVEYALFYEVVKNYLFVTQQKKVQHAMCFDTATEERHFFTRLSNELSKKGVVEILRKGFKYKDVTFEMYQPLPSELNESAAADYEQNIFGISKEICYDGNLAGDGRVDMVLSINGLPLLTIELKNPETGQTYKNAIKQYQEDRSPKEQLFSFKRCAVHFALDTEEAWMCTKLTGKSSWFLPFNKGCNDGAGNPVNPNGYRTSYFWEEIFAKRKLSDIIENFAQVVVESKWVKDSVTKQKKEVKEEKMVWPRYHQLEAVNNLIGATNGKALGQKFLIQHSAGSGKSNSITWLAYKLANLFEGIEPKFDSVIIVTDRIVLDNQTINNMKAFARGRHILAHADSSADLKKALDDGKKVIVSTIFKFPYIIDAVGTAFRDKRFAIIIDEAHSSQTGKAAASLSGVVSGKVNPLDLSGNEDPEDVLENYLKGLVDSRKMAENANYYAFTATPKNKTLEMFGIPCPPNADGKVEHIPFHLYSMKQAIEEGFIMDVLKGYITYQSYYKIRKSIEGNPAFDRKKGQVKIRAFVEAQPETVEKKASIIVQHFIETVIGQHKIGGQARAMVVTSSILRAIEFYYAINKCLEELQSPYRAIVAFSGEKEYNGKLVTEATINGFPSAEITDRIQEDPYRILVVADKFQTGYDEPLLHTMYVDKVLSDVKTVQTLSRLNRCHPKKTDTCVLDFANDAESVLKDFQRYFKQTKLSEESDPNKLNDLTDIIESYNMFSDEDVDLFNLKYWSKTPREQLEPLLDAPVQYFKDNLEEPDKIRCKSAIKNYCRVYPFLSAVMPYGSTGWEKLYTYLSLLVKKLPKVEGEDFTQGLLEAIDFDQLRIIKQEEHDMSLTNTDAEVAPIPVGMGGNQAKPEMDTLDNIIDEFNAIYGDIDWENPDVVRRQILELPGRLAEDATFRNSVENSDKETARQDANEALMNVILKMLSENSQLASVYMDNENFRNLINGRIFNEVYNNLKGSPGTMLSSAADAGAHYGTSK
ncbi:MAG: DEAD/DEAH box helicase family protein [Paludibacteraceae bacterium]|nr:DEAD/DEAH box helicase family protein [Paludibacteraceae bacterium]